MRYLYARPSWRLARQITSDMFMLLWACLCFLAGRFVDGVIAALAGPPRAIADSAKGLQKNFHDAADKAAKVPGIGGELRRPFDGAAGGLGDMARQAMDQVHAIETTASVSGWLTFLIPVTIVLAFWLPPRIRFFRTARAAQRYIDSSADLDLFALRAMARQPMYLLAKISPDPVAAWRAGDQRVIAQLADLELTSSGLDYRPRAGAARLAPEARAALRPNE